MSALPFAEILSDLDHPHGPADVLSAAGSMSRRQYRSSAACGGVAMLLPAAAMLLAGILLLAVRRDLLPSVGWVLWFGLTLMACYVALAKLIEPVLLVSVDADGITYHHQKGQWRLAWQDLQSAQQIELAGEPVGWIGFRLRQPNQLLQQIPLRLAVFLLIEQRPLLLAASGSNCATGHCASEYLQVTTEFEWQQQRYCGVQAMFAQRMSIFRQLLGSELVIPAQLLDCSVRDFCLEINRFRLNFPNENNG